MPEHPRDPAADLGFAFRIRKSGDVEVLHHGRVVTLLRGKEASAFLARAQAADGPAQQHLMARITGNYKRGNERQAAAHGRSRA